MKRFGIFFLCLPLLAGGIVADRYIVELSGEPVATHLSRLGVAGGGWKWDERAIATARQHRTRVRAEQEQARSLIEQQEATVVDSVDTVANALIVEIPDAQAGRLSRIPGVARVHQVREFDLLLDHALPLLKVPAAWNQVGIDNAGVRVKIGFIDTGIDIDHPGFKDPSLQTPDGFPKVNAEPDLAFTNSKVIVARSYAKFFRRSDPDPSPRDHVGHGTATAMAAAGVSNTGPLAVITGVAPKAWLGSYKVFGSPGVNDGAPEDAILKAIDDAVADGMDVINLSLGSSLAERPEDDPEVQALERAAVMGVLVVAAAGNNGPDPVSISSPATAPSVIAVGASANDRIFSAVAIVNSVTYIAVPGSGPNSPNPITAPIVDVAALDNNGMACSPLPPDSLARRIALILRGVCTFEDKLNNAEKAGAVAALVYTDQDRPDSITMSVGLARLPAEMVSYASGVEIKKALQSEGGIPDTTLRFTLGPVAVNSDRLASFSAIGPNVDLSIKPDLVAVGANVYTAAEKSDAKGGLFSPDGYSIEQGTSFSAPLVAGAAALLKSARPGLSINQYRSLLIDNAAPISVQPGIRARVQQAGAGLLDLSAALRSTAAMSPVSLSFGSGASDFGFSRNLTISNIGAAAETFQLSVVQRDGGPAAGLSTSNLPLDPGASAAVAVNFTGSSVQPGQYEGYISVQGTNSGVESRVPFWYGIASDSPRNITVPYVRDNLKPDTTVSDAILFRVTDASGLVPTKLEPTAKMLGEGSEVLGVISRNSVSPGLYGIRLHLGPIAGRNTVRIQAGDVVTDVEIVAR
jgi:minor extracellular serine protease Vpr